MSHRLISDAKLLVSVKLVPSIEVEKEDSPLVGSSMRHGAVMPLLRKAARGRGLPVIMQYFGFKPLTTRRHVRFGPGLVEEHEAGRIDWLPVAAHQHRCGHYPTDLESTKPTTNRARPRRLTAYLLSPRT